MTTSRKRYDHTIVNGAPCPWCGSPPEATSWHGGGPNKTRVSCSNDYCAVGPSVTAESKPAALRKWNSWRPR